MRQVLQVFDGTVLAVLTDCIRVRLEDLTSDNPDEIADLYWTAIPKEDMAMVMPGAMFRWEIGKTVEDNVETCFSEIKFMRLPPWTKKELVRAQKKARKMWKHFKPKDAK